MCKKLCFSFFLLPLFVSTFSFSLHAREVFEFNLGEKIRVLSDTAFRKSSENIFEAVGNVIITHLSSAIYGEKATLSFETGEAEIVGNVRYVGAEMTLYGSRLKYNFNDESLLLENARIVTENTIVIGRQIRRGSDATIEAIDAEYTTCQDCPESWSIFGEKVSITLGEYVRIKNAYIKVKGVVVMFVPYIILPIKKERESGLLFPNLGFNLSEGARFELPWFWAINDSSDMTFTPTFYGRRGLHHKYQYRHVLGEQKWFEVNSLQAMDKIYEPGKIEFDPSGRTEFRHFSDYEHHFSFGHRFNHHLHFNETKDLDTIRDYEFYNANRLMGPELGLQSHFNFGLPQVEFNVEGTFFRNMLTAKEEEFDDSYVQILPRANVILNPHSILQTSYFGLNRLSFGGEFEYTRFKQNNILESNFVRNAHRYHLAPYLDWQLGFLGPVHFQTRATLDRQIYRFPYEEEGRDKFSKSAVLTQSEMKIEIERVFGVAYSDVITIDQIDRNRVDIENFQGLAGQESAQSMNQLNDNLIGDVPLIARDFADQEIVVSNNSYRHSQEYKLRHYYLNDEKNSGSRTFFNQILQTNGQFDSLDAFRDRQTEITDGNSVTSLPLNNTLEAVWNNTLIMKSAKKFDVFEDQRYLRDNFTYRKIAHFNVSQGYDFTVGDEETNKRLTRLHLDTGFTLDRFRFDFNEYYFYIDQEHLFSGRLSYFFTRGEFSTSYNYNSFASPVYKFSSVSGKFALNDLIEVRGLVDFDIDQKRTSRMQYGLLYSPVNECWKLDLSFKTTRIDKALSFNILINFNDNNFNAPQSF